MNIFIYFYSLEESLEVNLTQLDSSEAISALALASPGHTISGDKTPQFLDKSLFNIETPTLHDYSTSKLRESFSSKVTSIDLKSPLNAETPKISQDINDISPIPTITTDCDESEIAIDQIPKVDPQNHNAKMPLNVNQLQQLTLGTPVSASEVAAALLGNSSTNLVTNRYKDVAKYKRSLMFEGNDLSSPYNHYRCISPSDSNIHQLNQHKFGMGTVEPRQNSGRMLKRQFSLDRADDTNNALPESNLAMQNVQKSQPKLCKQNSAGAASDLERIEEIPLGGITLPSPRNYKRLLGASTIFAGSSKSVSNESLVGIDKR